MGVLNFLNKLFLPGVSHYAKENNPIYHLVFFWIMNYDHHYPCYLTILVLDDGCEMLYCLLFSLFFPPAMIHQPLKNLF